MSKIRPSVKKDREIEELLECPSSRENFMREFILTAAEALLQRVLEHEVSDFLDREPYERKAPSESKGYRNGYLDQTLKSLEGLLHIRRPRTRDTEIPFQSRILSQMDRLDPLLKKAAIESYVRGLSTRDIEESLQDEEGQPLLSKSSVSRLAEELGREYEAFIQRDLSDLDVVYLFVDGVYEAIRHYTNNQAILVAWAISANGEKVLLHLSPTSKEDTAGCELFFEEMLRRGLRQPLLVVSDGGKGLCAAIASKFPKSDRQRCLAHKARNIQSKVPEHAQEEVLARMQGVYHAVDYETGKLLSEQFVRRYRSQFPAMVRCFLNDLESCLVHLKYPLGHRKYIRTTNLLERSFVEEKRRTKIIPRHCHEQGMIQLVFGIAIRVSRKWNRVKMSHDDLETLRNIRNIMTGNENEDDYVSFRLVA